MALYFILIVPLSARIPLGLYRDGVWADDGASSPTAASGASPSGRRPRSSSYLLPRGGSRPLRLPVPAERLRRGAQGPGGEEARRRSCRRRSASLDSEDETAEPIAVVLVSRRQGRELVDAEHKVRTLQELYDLCRHAGPGAAHEGLPSRPDGEIRLNFGSYLAGGAPMTRDRSLILLALPACRWCHSHPAPRSPSPLRAAAEPPGADRTDKAERRKRGRRKSRPSSRATRSGSGGRTLRYTVTTGLMPLRERSGGDGSRHLLHGLRGRPPGPGRRSGR